jgi:hypothetical protein
MTVKPTFKASIGRSAFGQYSDKNLKWREFSTESTDLGSLNQNIKWRCHSNVQTEAAPLTINFPTTHPIIRFTCGTHFCCRNSLQMRTVTGRICCLSLPSLKPTSSLQGGGNTASLDPPCLAQTQWHHWNDNFFTGCHQTPVNKNKHLSEDVQLCYLH